MKMKKSMLIAAATCAAVLSAFAAAKVPSEADVRSVGKYLTELTKGDVSQMRQKKITKEQYADAMRMVFRRFAEDKPFYKKAFEIRGQNGFEEILVSKCIPLFVEAYKSVDFHYANPLITRENIAQYQSLALVMYLKMWLGDGCYGDADYNDVCEAFIFMLTQGNHLMTHANGLALIAREIRKVFKK